MVTFIATAFAKEGSGMKVPKVSEALKSFALPALAEAMAREEKEQKARQTVASIIAMAGRTGGKVEIVRGNQ